MRNIILELEYPYGEIPLYALISGHPGGEVTPGTYAGTARDLSTLFNNLKGAVSRNSAKLGITKCPLN